MTQVRSSQALYTVNALKEVKYNPSFSKSILATQYIRIISFQSPMNPLVFKFCAPNTIHSNKVHFNFEMLSWCQMGLWTLKSLKSDFVHHK